MTPFHYRPAFGRVLAAVVALICAGALVTTVISDGLTQALGIAPWLALAAVIAWALFWRPEVAVDDSGVRLVNVARTIDLPWPSIQAVDTKWALTLITSYGKYSAWAAPTSTRKSGAEISPKDMEALPESTFGPGRSIRPGDALHAPSGQVALVVRRRFEELRDAGYLDNPVLERDRPPVHWHLGTLLCALALIAAGLLLAL